MFFKTFIIWDSRLVFKLAISVLSQKTVYPQGNVD
jgi:hypothetical protein